MPTVVCHHCSEVFTVNGPKPDQCPSCGHTLHIEGDPTPTGPALHSTIIQLAERKPTAFGRYVVQSRLGAGGFGSVFLAKDPQLARLVAIKVPRGETGRSPVGLERFAREARNIAQLRHPGIVSVFNVELDGELPFIVCEYVEGETLSDHMRKAPLSFRDAAQLVADVATAVDYAHECGIIHRDIKPSNIMIASDGKPRLMDFGLAKREAIDDPVTSPHAILGTPAYMSPEQAWGGKRGTVDRRSDIYSLGTVLYQLLTRELPFRGEPRMVLRQVIEEDPKSPRTLNADIPRDLETICEKAMQKELAGRYQTAGALADDLHRWLRGEPIEARPVTRLERSWRWCRRNPTAAGLVLSLLLLPTIIAMCAVVVAGKERKAADASAQVAQVEKKAHASAEVARKQAVERADELARLNKELSEMISKSYVERGSEYLRWDDAASDYSPLKALPWFQAAMEVDDKQPTRRDASRVRMGALLRAAPRVRRAWPRGGLISALAVAPAGDRFFTGGYDGTGRLWSPDQDLPLRPVLVHPAKIVAAAFSPDGKLLVTGCTDGSVRLWEIAGGKLVGSLRRIQASSNPKGVPDSISRVAFSRDGRLFLAVAGNLARVFETNGLKPVGKPCGASGLLSKAELADGGRLLVTSAFRGPLSVWDIQTGVEKHRLSEPSQTPRLLGAAGDGKIVAATQTDESVALWDCVTGKKAGVGRLPHKDKVHCARFSADGRRLATGTVDGTVSLWNVADGRLLWKIRPSRADVSELEFFSRGSRLAAVCKGESENWVCVLECDRGNLIGEPLHLDSSVLLARPLGESGDLVTVGRVGDIRVWEVEGVDPTFQLPSESKIRNAAIAADRRTVAVFTDEKPCYVLRGQPGQPFSAKTALTFQIGDGSRLGAVSPDGSRLAVADGSNSVSIFDAYTGRPVVSGLEHRAPVTRLLFTTDGRLLITVLQDSTVIPNRGKLTAWDARSGERKQQFDAGSLVQDVDLRRSDNLCVVAVGKQGILWDPLKGRASDSVFTQISTIMACRFSPDGRLILTSGSDGVARIWDVASFKQLAATPPTRGYITCMEFSPDGALFVTGHRKGAARIWRVPDARPATSDLVHGAPPSRCVWSADSRFVTTLSDGPLPDRRVETVLRCWDASTGEPVFARVLNRLSGRYRQPVGAINPWRIASAFFAPDGRQFHVVTFGGLLASFDLTPDARPLAEVLREVKLRSGAAFDQKGGLSFEGPSLPLSMTNTADERNDEE
jgi:WD40 repeat protein